MRTISVTTKNGYSGSADGRGSIGSSSSSSTAMSTTTANCQPDNYIHPCMPQQCTIITVNETENSLLYSIIVDGSVLGCDITLGLVALRVVLLVYHAHRALAVTGSQGQTATAESEVSVWRLTRWLAGWLAALISSTNRGGRQG